MELTHKISVIIPVYNVKKYIEKSVKSVCEQTYQNLEIILVDDGATDGSGELCDQLAKEDARIRVIHKVNGGLSDARNAGMDIMSGDYVGFVDGDDWIEPTMYEKLLKACTEQNCQVACCRYQTVTAIDKQTKEQDVFLKGSIKLSIHDVVKHYILESPMPAIYHSAWSKLYHKDTIKDMRFIKGRKSEDIPFAAELFTRVTAFAYVDEPLYDYNNIREGSIMNVKSIEHTFEHEIPGWLYEFECFKQSEELEDLYETALFYFYWRMLSYAKDCHIQRDEKEQKMYQRLKDLLMKEKKNVKASCSNPLVNKKYAIRLKIFLFNPGLYWFLDGLR